MEVELRASADPDAVAGRGGDLPRLDRHAVPTGSPLEAAWDALVRTLARSFGGRRRGRFARLLGCRDLGEGRFEGRVGDTLPGFRVVRAEPPRLLVLDGEHRFARYRLAFRVDPSRDGSYVSAETHAAFPRLHGAVYRGLVVGTGGHVFVTRRILHAIARSTEAS